MYLYSREIGVVVGSSGLGKSSSHRVAGRGPTHDFLTLPDAGTVAVRIKLRRARSSEYRDIARAHFQYGPLRAQDVDTFNSPSEAIYKALMPWIRRRTRGLKRITFEPVLLDTVNTQDIVSQSDWNGDNDEVAGGLYLGLQTLEDRVFPFGRRARQLLWSDPLLLRSAIAMLARGSCNTLEVRTPDTLLDMFAQWAWDDPTHGDREAEDYLNDRFGDDEESKRHYLPSNVRPRLCPTDIRVSRYEAKRRRYVAYRTLGQRALRLRATTGAGPERAVAKALLDLSALLPPAGRGRVEGEGGSSRSFEFTHRTYNAYAGATLIFEDNEFVGEALDNHYEWLSSGGEGTFYHGFIALGSDEAQVRRFYAGLARGFGVLRAMDRLLVLLS